MLLKKLKGSQTKHEKVCTNDEKVLFFLFFFVGPTRGPRMVSEVTVFDLKRYIIRYIA